MINVPQSQPAQPAEQAPNAAAIPAAPEGSAGAAPEAVATPAATEGSPGAGEGNGEDPGASKQDPKFAARFAALTRKEAALRAKEAQYKEQSEKYRAFEEAERLIADNPLAYLEKKGISLERLTQIALNDGKKPVEMQMQELKEQLEREKKANEEKAAKDLEGRYENQRKQFLGEINDHLAQASSEYEFTLMNSQAPEIIYNVIENHYNANKRILSVKEAADLVEKHFEKEVEEALAKSNKLKAKFQPKEPAPPAPPANAAPSSPTLTNSQATTVPTPGAPGKMTVEESKAAAAKLLRWT